MHSPTLEKSLRIAATWAVTTSWLAMASLDAVAATNGKIVFQRGSGAFADTPYNRGGQLYVTDPSTYSPAGGTVTETLFGDGSQPHVSLDGTKVVFLDNTHLTVTPTGSYSPQGIVVAGGGSNLTGLHPRLSPDATLIAYQNPGALGKVAVTTVGCTSGNERNPLVCNWSILDGSSAASNVQPSWYPLLQPSGGKTNAWILFVRKADQNAGVGDISMTSVSIAPGGVVTEGSTVNLTRSPAAYSFPSYSPNGLRILFGKDGGLWTMGSDGTAPKQIVHDTGGSPGLLNGRHPVWSPDSRKIAFDYGDASGQIYVADITFAGDGTATASNVIAMSGLNGTSEADTYPSWLPSTGSAPSLVLTFDGRLRDRVGRGDAAISPDGEFDGTFTVTMPTAGLTVSKLELCQQSFPCPNGPTTVNRWDTVPGNAFRVIGAADTLDQQPRPLLNETDGSINQQFGSTFKIFVSDVLPSAFVEGTWFTLTATVAGAPISGRILLTKTPSSLADVGILLSPRPPSRVRIGQVFTYSILVNNNGPDAAKGVAVTDVLPPSLQFVSSASSSSCTMETTQTVTCAFGDIPSGPRGATSGPSVRTATIAVRGLLQGQVTNSLRVRVTSPADPKPDNDLEYAATTVMPDLELIGLEVTQGIQDLANNVPLVAGKHTFVRAHLKALNSASVGFPISATLTARDVATGNFLGTMRNSNVAGTIPTVRNPDRGLLDDSLYFEVPFGQFAGNADWTQGRVSFELSADDAALSCAEPDNNPNDCKASVTFQSQQPLSIKFVGVTWSDAAGVSHTPVLADVMQTMSEALGILPISTFDLDLGVTTTAFDPCDVRGNNANFGKIKAEIAKLRQDECAAGPCKSVYLGLMADQNSCSANPLNGQGTFPVPDPDPSLSWGRAALAFVPRNGIVTRPGLFNPAMDFNARVHELTHCAGAHHTASGAGEGGPDPSYTPANGNISASTSPFERATAYGFDVNQISPQRVYGPTTLDFMAYSRPRWVGVYNYNRLFRFFSPTNGNAVNGVDDPARRSLAANAGQLLLVSGQVSTTAGTGQLDPLNVTSAPGDYTLPTAGSYAIRLEGATGQELAAFSFEPNRSTEDDTALVSLVLPWNAETRRVVLLHAGVPLASRQASATPPAVTVVSPNGGELLDGATALLSWTASDPDGDALVYTVEYSPDGGTTWRSLVVDWTSTSYRADQATLPGSTRALIRVTAHDGFHSTRDQSDATFVVPPHAPQTAITTPEDGRLYVGSQTILLQGMGLDLEDGLLQNASLTWSSSLNGALGTGSLLTLDAASLPEGTHVVTLTGRDSGGQTGASRITIRVFRTRPDLLAGPLVVPIVLDVDTGAAHYTTELTLTNPGSSSVNVGLTYTAALGTKEGSGTVSEAVPAGQQVIFPDVIAHLRSRGLGIPAAAGSGQGGVLLVTPSGSSATFVATARTSAATQAPLPTGAAGLAYGGIPISSGVEDRAIIFGLRSTNEDRSNVAVFNMSAEPVTVKVTAISGQGDGRSVVIAAAETLPAYGWLQHSKVLDGTGISNGYATVERVSASGKFGAYGVINDNTTNDGSFVAPVTGSFSGNTLTLPVVVETSAFRSELVLANRSSATATLTLRYVESLNPSKGVGGTATITLASGEQRIIPEAVDFLRTQGVSIGAKDSAGFAGAVRVTVAGASLSDTYVGARTASRSPAGGQFGLFTPPVYSGEEAASGVSIYDLQADQSNRSNVAVVHAGADGSGPISLQLQAFDGSAGGAAKGERLTVTLEPGQWAQPSGFFAASGVQNGYVRISRTAGSAPWLAYGVINDGSQPGSRTGDGAYILAIPTEGDSSTLR